MATAADASTSQQQQHVPPSLIPVTPIKLVSRWQPKTHLEPPRPYPPDVERMNEPELIQNPAQMPGAPELMRNPKKVRPRRTVDYNGSLARWRMLRKMRPNSTYIPCLRPSPTYIINLLPPQAYLNNSSTSICTKFVHTSTNKIKFPVNVVAWTPEGRRVLTGSTSGEFTLWNGLTFNFETILQAHDTAIRAFQFSHNGSYLISADQSGIIKYFQPNMNNLVMWNGHKEPIRGVTFSPDDQRFATASDDQTIKLWDFQTRTEERTFTGHGWDVRCVEWHPTKGLLASGSKDNLVKFWDPRTGQTLSNLHYHKGTVQAIQWNPNGDTLATASRDQTIRVFDIRAMKELQLFKGHKKDVCSIAWHPVHHDLLASGGAEGSIIYWGVGYSTPRAIIEQAHDSNVWALAWHPLGHIICSGSNDYTVRFWSRDRPGDTSNKGEKPPAAGARDGEDDEDESYVPGLHQGQGQGGGGGGGGGGGFGGGRDDYDGPPAWNPDRRNNAQTDNFIPGLGGSSRAPPLQVEEPTPAFQAQAQMQTRTQWNGPASGGSGAGGTGGGTGGYGRGGREDYDDRNRGHDYGQRHGGFGGRGGGGGGVGNGVRRDDRMYGRY